MLSKKVFVEAINAIEGFQKDIEKLNDLGVKIDICSNLYDIKIQMLFVLMDACGDNRYNWISYYCLAKDFGRKWEDGDALFEDEPLPAIKTPEALYDFICQYYAKEVDEDIE